MHRFVQIVPVDKKLGQSVLIHDSHYFVNIFAYWPSRMWCNFDNKITTVESTNSKLCMIGYYSMRSINTIHIFSHLACIFGFIERWCPSLTVAQTILDQAITELCEKFLVCYIAYPDCTYTTPDTDY